MKRLHLRLLVACTLLVPAAVRSQTPEVPDWAQPGSATHVQVPPPPEFRRATRTSQEKIGQFDGQSDVGGTVVPGSSRYDKATKRYTISSAGYNIWYTRDEFRFLWKKMSGDVSLAADVTFPNPDGYGDRKVVLIIRQDLDDDAKEIMSGLHGAGLIHLAERPSKGAAIKEATRLEAPTATTNSPAAPAGKPTRIGIEKHGDNFTLYVSSAGEPMQPVGATVSLRFDAPFYVGIGFCSHLPATLDTAVLSNLVFERSAGKVR